MVTSMADALRLLWTGVCNVYVRQSEVNPDNGRDEDTEVLVVENEPCRISFANVTGTSEESEAAKVQQVIKLFIARDIEIPAGSKIVVTQNGTTKAYKRSGLPATYSTHQEIVLETFERWA